jgi:hypothetical protein
MQKTAGEVTHPITSHNQNTNTNKANAKRKQQQTAPHLWQNTAPKTTTNRKQNVKSFKAIPTIMHADTGDI